ncbi:hypothetical protein BS78_09G157100 [Paspalum vaginatum]|nr:hypothetical protein BS78_09G157100 [Paspalum vaginatum]
MPQMKMRNGLQMMMGLLSKLTLLKGAKLAKMVLLKEMIKRPVMEGDSTLPELNAFEGIQECEKLNGRSGEVGVKETQMQQPLEDLHGMNLRKLQATYKELLSKEAAEGKRLLPVEVDHNVCIIP